MVGFTIIGVGVVIWQILKIPPKIVKWVLNNKMKTAIIIVAGWWGCAKLREKLTLRESNTNTPVSEKAAPKTPDHPAPAPRRTNQVPITEAIRRYTTCSRNNTSGSSLTSTLHPMQVATGQTPTLSRQAASWPVSSKSPIIILEGSSLPAGAKPQYSGLARE